MDQYIAVNVNHHYEQFEAVHVAMLGTQDLAGMPDDVLMEIDQAEDEEPFATENEAVTVENKGIEEKEGN
jgi:hypothetical protein